MTLRDINDPLVKEALDLVQFTGLLDMNGKEIYEGDIVEVYSHGAITVEWQESTSGFYPFADSPGNCGCCGSGSMAESSLIIGNIYESQELPRDNG